MAINLALLSPDGVALRRRYEVSLHACMLAARTDALTADSSTGRNVQTSHRTGAARMAKLFGLVRNPRTYRKARDIIRLLGFVVVVDEGRYLTKTERLEAALKAPANSRRPAQRRKASTRVFTMGRLVVGKIGHLPRRGSTSPKRDLSSTHQERAKARKAAPPQPKTMEIPRWGLDMQRLAGRLVNEATFLRPVPTRGICAALAKAGIDPRYWTAHDVSRAMYAAVTEKRWTAPARMDNPMGYLRFLLGTITPAQVREHVQRKIKAEADRQVRLASARAATARAMAREGL